MKILRTFWLLLLPTDVSVLICVRATTAFAFCTTPLTNHLDGNVRRISSQTVGSPKTRLSSGTRSDDDRKAMWEEKYRTAELAASKLGVKPLTVASDKSWKRASKLMKRVLPLLHSTDNCIPPNNNYNLSCMWWKGIFGNDRSSPVYDNGLAYDLLPSGWRKIIRPRRLYPRFHHVNVELRTAYLDSQITEIVGATRDQPEQPITNDSSSVQTTKIRMVCMGAGYDTRGVRMIERKMVDQVIELDLPDVVDAKDRLFRRLQKRRPWLKEISMPILVPADFNDLSDVEEKLTAMLLKEESSGDDVAVEWHTIVVFEAVMIYLDDNVPSSLLNITSRILRENSLKGSLCFADQLENVAGNDFDMGAKELKDNGWNLKDWCPKPGFARHMGYASLSNST